MTIDRTGGYQKVAVFKGKDVWRDDEFIDICIALSNLEDAQKRLSELYLTLGEEEFDGIKDNYIEESAPIREAKEEMMSLVNEAERDCARNIKKIKNTLEKDYCEW